MPSKRHTENKKQKIAIRNMMHHHYTCYYAYENLSQNVLLTQLCVYKYIWVLVYVHAYVIVCVHVSFYLNVLNKRAWIFVCVYVLCMSVTEPKRGTENFREV